MSLTRRTALALPALLPVAAAAQAQAPWAPTRSMRIVVPFTAGGATDVMARVVAERLTHLLGQPCVVENRPGAGGNLGVEVVAKSDADGHTLLMCTIGTASINQFLYPRLPFDPVKDLAAVALASLVTNAVVVHPGVSATNIQELIALAKREPGTINYGTPGNGTSGHICGEYFKNRTGVDIGHVPYRGTGALIPDLLAGRIQMTFDNLPSYIPHIREGRLRVLAVTSRERWFALPEVPTVNESGLPDFEAVAWFGLQVQGRTPRPAVDRLTAAVQEICREPGTIAKFRELGAMPSQLGGADFDRFIAAENEKWGAVVRAANIRLE
ncbi:tripartite tricarboxylate transporter substrate binding protein [Roseococcus sp. XZZS9]|uniref:Tripartite tricarboxylate transporter substrate binding protein n=1 Tax=Roseococcus pinisoli TaxID=2835040 RepID=A0ABS5QCZ5_9PROT|nr:tripartite tricarboxylate transporter substrate binding protein [Roseococcus pinisoli]MBS7810468.1 tripartite tricarboxylate transporter substrate binding protein [Roseococcus pinisoli]